MRNWQHLDILFRPLMKRVWLKQVTYCGENMTSDCDIIGPYFTSAGTVDSKFILSCVLETIGRFEHHELSTSS